jgi:excisionase family DNA binding protein
MMREVAPRANQEAARRPRPKVVGRLPAVAVINNMSASLHSGVPAQAGSTAHRPLTAADVLSAREVAELLHMPTSTVEHLARQGTLPSRKIGRRRLYVRQHVEALLLDETAQTGPREG